MCFLKAVIASLLLSTPMYLLFKRLAAVRVTPQPQKKSATISPSLVAVLIILFKSFKGFCVGYKKGSFCPSGLPLFVIGFISFHQSVLFPPLFLSKKILFNDGTLLTFSNLLKTPGSFSFKVL